jgi:hypothetical protein
MTWSYVGSGCWELQGGLLLGCIYGNKFDNKCSITIERLGGADSRVKELVRLDGLDLPIDKAKEVVLAQYRILLETDLELLKRVF